MIDAILARVKNEGHAWPMLKLADATRWVLVQDDFGHWAESCSGEARCTLSFTSCESLLAWYGDALDNPRNKLLQMARYVDRHKIGVVLVGQGRVNLWEAFAWYEHCADAGDRKSIGPSFEALRNAYPGHYQEYRDCAMNARRDEADRQQVADDARTQEANHRAAKSLDEKIALIGIVNDLMSVTRKQGYQLRAALTKLSFEATDEEWDYIQSTIDTLSREAQDLTRERAARKK